jgi:hypothetical protein
VATAAALANPDMVQSLILFEPALCSLIKEEEAGSAARNAAESLAGQAARTGRLTVAVSSR